MALRKRRPWNLQEFQRELQRIAGDNLVTYWPIDDISGTEFRDLGPNNEPLAITGVTLDQKGPPQLGKSGLWDGINDVGSQKVYEDETGASWGPTVHGLSLADGVAFIRTEGVDLSPFAGDGSTTPYMIVLTDSSSKVAWGYAYTVDAAEGLGGELVGNPGFETGGTGGDFNGGTEVDDGTSDNFTTWNELNSATNKTEATATAHSGSYALKIVSDGSFPERVEGNASVTAGELYKASFWARGSGGVQGQYAIRDVTAGAYIIPFTDTGVAGDTYTQVVVYFTAPAGCSTASLWLGDAVSRAGTWYYDDASIKEVLQAGTDAVHIVSARDGGTRNWAGIDGSFDYNDSAYTFQIRKSLFQQTGAITVGAWVKPAAASLAESEYFIAKRASADLSWALYRNTSEQYSTFVSLSGASTASSIVGTPHVDTDWRFVMFTFEPSVALILYVNGSAEASDTIGIPASLFDSSAPLTVGDYSELVRTWQGNIAHAFVMDRSLSASEIHRLWEIGSRAHGG